MRLLLAVGRSELHERTETSDFHRHLFARFRVGAEHAFSHLVLEAQVGNFFHFRVEQFIEIGNLVVPFCLTFSDMVEFLLHVGSEVVVHDVGEIFHKEIVDHHTHVGRDELVFLVAVRLFLLRFFDFAVF